MAWLQSYVLPSRGLRASSKPSNQDGPLNFNSAQLYMILLVQLTPKGGFHLKSVRDTGQVNLTEKFARADGKHLQIDLHWTGKHTEIKMFGD